VKKLLANTAGAWAIEEMFYWLQQQMIVGCFDDQSQQSSSQPILASCSLEHVAAFCYTNFIRPSVCLSMTSWSTAKTVRDKPVVTMGSVWEVTTGLLRGHIS